MKTKKVKKEGLEGCSMFGFGYDPNENECILCEKEYPEDFSACKEQTLGEKKTEKKKDIKKGKQVVAEEKKIEEHKPVIKKVKEDKKDVKPVEVTKKKTALKEGVKDVKPEEAKTDKKINTAEVEIKKVYKKLVNTKGKIEDRIKEAFREETAKRVLKVVATLKKKPASLVEIRKIYGGGFIYFIIMAMERAGLVKRNKEGLFFI